MTELDDLTLPLVVVEDQVTFTLASLCRTSGARIDEVLALVAEGLLQPTGQHTDDWRFSGDALSQTRRAMRLARDLELSAPGVVLVIGLLSRIDLLQAMLRRR